APRDPLQAVPPPRIESQRLPDALGHKMEALIFYIMDLQGRHPASFGAEATGKLLRMREELVQVMSRQDWEKAGVLCDATRAWLATVVPHA
ncbi:MAG: hypothetical protein AAB368_09990, partial [bacterium]